MSTYQPYRSELLPTARVRELSVLRPQRALLDITWSWIIILAAWTAAAVWTEWWIVAVAIPVVGTRYYALFIIGHDAMHRRLLPGSAQNDLIADLLIFGPIGAVTRVNKRNHLEHHRHLGSTDDPDRHKHSCMGKDTRSRFMGFVTGLSSFVPVVRNVFLSPGAGHEEPKASDGEGLLSRYRPRDIAIILGWQAALIVGLTVAIGWWAFIVLWLLPVYVFMYLGDLLRAFLEHAHPESDAAADEHRLTTFVSTRVERLFFAPMNMNFHATHHLWPSIPYYNLPVADREMQAHPLAQEIERRRSYVGHLVRWFRALPLRDCESSPRATNLPV
jgi:fatty acid desaturase